MIQLFATALVGFFVWTGVSAGGGEGAKLSPDISSSRHTGVLSVRITGYNAVPEQTNDDPMTTASGARSNPDVVVARSRDLADALPFGTIIAIEAPTDGGESCGFSAAERFIGYRVVADVMHARKREAMDIMFDTNDIVVVGGKKVNPADALGICDGITVRVVGKISIQDMPVTQMELVKIIRRDG